MKTGELVWESDSPWSLDRMLDPKGDTRKAQAMQQWLSAYVQNNQRPQFLFENSVLGSLSSDGTFVYCIDDLALPPPYATSPYATVSPANGNYSAEVADAIQHNRLKALSLPREGALAWELGGRSDKGELNDSYFLGPPLPLGGKLYVLT